MEHLEILSDYLEGQGSQMFQMRSSPDMSCKPCSGDVFLWQVSAGASWNPQSNGITGLWTSGYLHPPSLLQPELILIGGTCSSLVCFSHLGKVVTKWFSSPLKCLNVNINMKSSDYQIITLYALIICHSMISGSVRTSTGNQWKIHIIIIWEAFIYIGVVYPCVVTAYWNHKGSCENQRWHGYHP